MGASLLVLALFVLVTLNLGMTLERTRANVDVRVFLVDGLDAERMAALQPPFLAIPGVREARFIGRDQALAEMRAHARRGRRRDRGPRRESVCPRRTTWNWPGHRSPAGGGEPSPTDLRRWPEVDDVVYSQAWVGALESWASLFRWSSLMVSLVVSARPIFVISNTVRLTMAGSRRVIEIQMLVGATDAFIRTPYLHRGHGARAACRARWPWGCWAGHRLLAVRLDGLAFFTRCRWSGFVVSASCWG